MEGLPNFFIIKFVRLDSIKQGLDELHVKLVVGLSLVLWIGIQFVLLNSHTDIIAATILEEHWVCHTSQEAFIAS